MSIDQHFNKDFDAELNAAMMAKHRASRPYCLWCGEDDTPTTTLLFCSACEMAWYCSKECQKKDWKKGEHKGFCQQFCIGRDELELTILVTMKSLGNITQEEYLTLIWDRLGMFAREMNRLATVRGEVEFHLQAAAQIVPDKGVHLGVSVIIPGNPLPESVDVICSLLLLKIDEGQAAESQICQGAGRISKAAKKKVLKYLCQMVAIFKEHKVLPTSIIHGKGLMFMTSNKVFTNKIQEAGNGYIMFMPSMDF